MDLIIHQSPFSEYRSTSKYSHRSW